MRNSRSVRPKAETVRSTLLQELWPLVVSHSTAYKTQGRKLCSKIDNDIDIDVTNHVIRFTLLETRSRSEEVQFKWDTESWKGRTRVSLTCSCGISKNVGLCPHTFAVASEMYEEVQGPHSIIVDAVLDGLKVDWKQVLKPLDRFISSTESSAAAGQPGDDSNGPSPDRHTTDRIIYRVAVESGHLEVNAFEQGRTKSGEWGRGRRITWSRLYSEPPACLGPVDQRVRKLIEPTRSSMYSYYSDSALNPDIWNLLEILKGHSLVFRHDENEKPLEIRQARLEMELKPTADQSKFRIIPKLDDSELASNKYLEVCHDDALAWFDPECNRLLMWQGKSDTVDLILDLLELPYEIPREHIKDLLARLTKLESNFRVVYPPEFEGLTTPGNTQAHLRLVPRHNDGGLSVEIWSRPMPDGAWFEPGEGGGSIAKYIKGIRSAIERDLNAEKAAAEYCQNELRLNRFYTHRPWHWMIDAGDASLDFLAELQHYKDAPWVTEWTNSTVPRPDVVGEIKPSNVQLEIAGEHDWFGVEGQIDVGGEKVPLIAVLDALRKNSKYVQLKGGKWAKIAAEFRDRLAALADLLHRNNSRLNIDSTAAPLLEDLFKDQQINIRAAAEWQAALKKLDDARHHNPKVPAGLKADLRDYQVEGYKWLSRLAAWGVGGCLADDMGLGKTVQALAVLLERKDAGPALVIAPVSVGFNWINEAAKFAPELRGHLYRDTERGDFLQSVGPGDLVVASYGLLLRGAEFFTKVRWGTLILDEAQFVKNSRTKSAQAVRELQADWRLALTGTPVENQLGDLWSLFRATSPGLFGSQERFRERFADPIEKQKIPERQQALARMVRPFILRRTKEEVLKELPARTEMLLTAELSAGERKLYEDARLFALAQLSGIDTGKNEARFQVLAMLTRLRQLSCHPRLVDQNWMGTSAKLDLLLETIEEIREGKHRALIFSQFTSHLEIIRKALDELKISYLYLDGQTPEKQRRENVRAFQSGTGDLFLISLKAGGTGLNLTGADYVIHMDPWWNPAVEDQATDRAHRIGQTKPVMVYRLVAQDTIEEKILALHEQKRNLVAGVMDGSDQAGKLSTEELIDLIKQNHRPEMTEPSPEKPRKAKSRGRSRTLQQG